MVPLGDSVLLLRFLDEVTDPLLQRGDLHLSISSLGLETGTPPPEVGRYIALLCELPLGRFPGSLLLL